MEHGINQVKLLGYLGADPELKLGAGGTAILKFRMATTERWFDNDNVKQERTEWHRVTIFGKRAEGLAKFLRKGMAVYVDGRLQHSSYEKDGQKRYSTDIIAVDIIVTTPKGHDVRAPSTDLGTFPSRPVAVNGALSSAEADIPF